MSIDLQAFANEDFCYLTTIGRVSGRPHSIEIWYVLHGKTLYMLSGGLDRSDWVKNLLRAPHVSVKIQDQVFPAHGRVVKEADEGVSVSKGENCTLSPKNREAAWKSVR